MSLNKSRAARQSVLIMETGAERAYKAINKSGTLPVVSLMPGRNRQTSKLGYFVCSRATGKNLDFIESRIGSRNVERLAKTLAVRGYKEVYFLK